MVSVVREPEATAESLKECDRAFFPTVEILQIFGTIPVTTSTAKKSFFCIKAAQDLFTKQETGLQWLVLVIIHKDRKVNAEDMIDIFCKKKSRRLAATNCQSFEI
ncbi:hypothetical protein AVEN_19287-1 [Araneus ventricosus]|uniref:HAT C-terminal dimerisation domain-containing protein n=1 Tax=Araneus ventricosus TaxID=182803 RepID=A0A4Y2USJ8_ARAVE|nr:hypothetical protein AVEN_19287-1 [Araneus ventricosus]